MKWLNAHQAHHSYVTVSIKYWWAFSGVCVRVCASPPSGSARYCRRRWWFSSFRYSTVWQNQTLVLAFDAVIIIIDPCTVCEGKSWLINHNNNKNNNIIKEYAEALACERKAVHFLVASCRLLKVILHKHASLLRTDNIRVVIIIVFVYWAWGLPPLMVQINWKETIVAIHSIDIITERSCDAEKSVDIIAYIRDEAPISVCVYGDWATEFRVIIWSCWWCRTKTNPGFGCVRADKEGNP